VSNVAYCKLLFIRIYDTIRYDMLAYTGIRVSGCRWFFDISISQAVY